MSTLKTTTLSNTTGSKTIPVDTVVAGTAKAWINFNGATVAGTSMTGVRDSFNVASVVDSAGGTYQVNFTTAMPNANYTVVFGVMHYTGVRYEANASLNSAPLTTSFNIYSYSANALYDNPYIMCTVFSN